MTEKKMLEKIANKENLILAGSPIVATCVTLLMQAGELAFYDIPYYMLQISPIQMLSAVIALTILFLVCIAVLSEAQNILAVENPYIQILKVPTTVLFIGMFLMLVTPGESTWESWALLLSITSIYLIADLISAFKNTNMKLTFHQKLVNLLETKKKINYTPSSYIKISIGFIFLIFYTAFNLGYNSAYTKTRHLTLSDTPNVVVVAIHNDQVLLKPYDPNSMKLSNSFSILVITPEKLLTLNYKNLGRLGHPDPT